MTTDITELAQRMKAAAGKATQGEWWADEVKNEGCYGSGDDCVEGFTSYAIYGSDGQTLFDSLNSDAACICEEYDGEGHVAWDETAQSNAEFIALANPNNVLALVEVLEKSEKTSEARREAIDRTHNMFVRERDRANAAEEALEKAQQRIGKLEKKLTDHKRMNQEMAKAMLTPNDSDAAGMEIAALRQRIADLGSRTVTVNLPQRLQPGADGWDDWYMHSDNEGEYLKFDDVLAMLTDAGIKVEAE
ncbi:ead/Ea22-like family protein [Klebsiella pneumoniae]|nr:ead/Ea22-like family protein [Klebsiella pneumoniae]